MKIFASYILILLFARGSVYAQSPEDIINKNLAARGGINALGNIKTLAFESTVMIQKNEIKLSVSIVFPGKIYVKTVSGGKELVTVFNGGKAWAKNNTGVKDIPPDKSDILKAQIMNQFAYFAYNLQQINEKGGIISYQGKENREGKEYYKLETNLLGKDRNIYYINTSTNLVDRIENKKDFLGRKTNSHLELDDFGRYSGILFPTKVLIFIGGKKLGEAKYSNVRVNESISEGLFTKPKN